MKQLFLSVIKAEYRNNLHDINKNEQDYDAFVKDLTNENSRTLTCYDLLVDFECYYKKCGVKKFAVQQDCVWFEFDLTLCFTAFRIVEDLVVLATEDDRLVKTEDGRYFINIKSMWDFVYEDVLATEDDKIVWLEGGGCVVLTKRN